MVLAVMFVFVPAPLLCKQYTKWREKRDAEKPDEATDEIQPRQEPQAEADLESTEEPKTDEVEANTEDQNAELPSNVIVLDLVSAEDENETETKRGSDKKAKWVIPLSVLCCILAVAVCVLGCLLIQKQEQLTVTQRTMDELITTADSTEAERKKAADIATRVIAEKRKLEIENEDLQKENKDLRAKNLDLFAENFFWGHSAVLVVQGGSRYHRYDCSHIEGKPYWIYNVELAQYRGYTPCLDCEPPK